MSLLFNLLLHNAPVVHYFLCVTHWLKKCMALKTMRPKQYLEERQLRDFRLYYTFFVTDDLQKAVLLKIYQLSIKKISFLYLVSNFVFPSFVPKMGFMYLITILQMPMVLRRRHEHVFLKSAPPVCCGSIHYI